MTTPEPSPLSESKLDKWQASCVKLIEREMNFPVCCDGLGPRELLELIAQARAARPSPWQSIETAPKDISILVSDGENVWQTHLVNVSYTVATHWQPLPSPPAQDGGLT